MFNKNIFLFRKWKLHRRKDLVGFSEKCLPGVSILKPLVNSADPSLFANLETFFTLDYPKYEIIFCVQDSEDTRLKMYIESLKLKYPTIQSKVSIRVGPIFYIFCCHFLGHFSYIFGRFSLHFKEYLLTFMAFLRSQKCKKM